MPAQGLPVRIVESGGFPVRPVEANYPLMTLSDNEIGVSITISDLGAPFVVDGYVDLGGRFALSGDNGENILSDNDEPVETF